MFLVVLIVVAMISPSEGIISFSKRITKTKFQPSKTAAPAIKTPIYVARPIKAPVAVHQKPQLLSLFKKPLVVVAKPAKSVRPPVKSFSFYKSIG